MDKKVSIDWSLSNCDRDSFIKAALIRFRRHLEIAGLKENTIKLYFRLVQTYLEATKDDKPTSKDALSFYESLHERKLSRSSLNNYAAAIIRYHQFLDDPVKLPFLKLNNSLPYYFDDIDIMKIFSVCKNIKHLCMLKVLFYGSLRSSELANLDDSDYNPDSLTLRLRETKNGADGIAYVNDETGKLLNNYLRIRPKLEIENRSPLFFTDFGNRWSAGDIHRMFMYYKEKSGIQKKGSVHCFSRHSSASILVQNGCDIRTVQELLRHRDIHTTLRYTHLNDKVTREKHKKYLVL